MSDLERLNGGEPPFIIVADDVVKNLKVIGAVLEDEGFEVAVATNGAEAVEMVEEDPPDLILLDVMMPEMDGFEACKIIKQNEKIKDIPIIFLTARTETEDIVKGFRLGGVDYVTKPFKQDELLARIRTQLELKFSRDVIVKQNNELKRLNLEKNEFLGIAAHDLKNPLGAIKGLVEVILSDPEMEESEKNEFLRYVESSTHYMIQLVSDLLDINKIEEGRVEFYTGEVNLERILKDSVEKFKFQAEKKNISLEFSPGLGEEKVKTDPNKIQQVIDNLISNAIKFSPFDKKIFVESRISGDKAVVSVIDQGPGISEEDQEKLFGKFARLSAKPTGDENSTGLGLSIVKKIVEGLEGRIWCESKLGEGAAFKFEQKLYAKSLK